MKKALAVFCLTIVLSACSQQNGDSYEKLPETSNPTTTLTIASELQEDVQTVNNNVSYPFNNSENDDNSKVPQVKNKLSDEEILKLNTKKCGYGQGIRLDSENRP